MRPVFVSVPFRGYLISNAKIGRDDKIIYVSVPFRSYLISNKCGKTFQTKNWRFRPLSGLSYFKLDELLRVNKDGEPFPSPFGVILFQIHAGEMIPPGYAFPSPFGVILFQIKIQEDAERSIEFPSPFGVILFQINFRRMLRHTSCFRPLSGLSYFKCKGRSDPMSKKEFPSPFGVILFQIINCICKRMLRKFPSPFGVILFQIDRGQIGIGILYLFPSPFGVILFQILKNLERKYADAVSVPFRGYLISNILDRIIHSTGPVSVPFRGYLISNAAPSGIYAGVDLCFRPLSGLSYFKWSRTHLDN